MLEIVHSYSSNAYSMNQTKYSCKTSDPQTIEAISLDLFETNLFELEYELSGTFGSFVERYNGNYFYEEGTLILSIEQAYSRKFAIHDEEPEEVFSPYHEIIRTRLNEDQSLRFILPESKNREVVLCKEV